VQSGDVVEPTQAGAEVGLSAKNMPVRGKHGTSADEEPNAAQTGHGANVGPNTAKAVADVEPIADVEPSAATAHM
jgi:hypothetical protein